jgi:hypothetical protein
MMTDVGEMKIIILHAVNKSSEVTQTIIFCSQKHHASHKYFQNERHKFEFRSSGFLTRNLACFNTCAKHNAMSSTKITAM